MDTLANKLSETIQQLGQGLLIAYFFPAVVFVLAHLYVLVPIWEQSRFAFALQVPASLIPAPANTDFASLVFVLLVAFAVATLLVGLNDQLILLYEGQPWWLRNFLLYPLTRFNQQRIRKNFAALRQTQAIYWETVSSWYTAKQGGASSTILTEYQARFSGIITSINAQYDDIPENLLNLPRNPKRVMPTAFGNAYAAAEEYAYERYRIDTLLFWSRLREAMSDQAPVHSEHLTNAKTRLDLTLNLSFLSLILAAESALTLRMGGTGYEGLLLILTVVGAVLFIVFYNGSVSAVGMLGELIMMSFDQYRHLLLAVFHLSPPADQRLEQVMWVQLAAFMRRGDPFYFPNNIIT